MREMKEQTIKTLETELDAAKSAAEENGLEAKDLRIEINEFKGLFGRDLVKENEALRRQNRELTASKAALKARAALCAKVHDTETKDIFGDPSVYRVLAAGRKCRGGKKCKFGRHPDGY